MPERLQLSRKAGSRLPEGAVNVARHGTRLGPWGNPFRIGGKVMSPGRWGTEAQPYDGNLAPGEYVRHGGDTYEIRLVRDRADAVALYIAYYSRTAWNDPLHLARIRRELGGKDLACYCPLPADGEPDICHGAALLRVGNGLRPVTPDVPHPEGGKTVHVKRSCNGCGLSLGDVTDEEIACAIDGRALPDARGECPACSAEVILGD